MDFHFMMNEVLKKYLKHLRDMQKSYTIEILDSKDPSAQYVISQALKIYLKIYWMKLKALNIK